MSWGLRKDQIKVPALYVLCIYSKKTVHTEGEFLYEEKMAIWDDVLAFFPHWKRWMGAHLLATLNMSGYYTPCS